MGFKPAKNAPSGSKSATKGSSRGGDSVAQPPRPSSPSSDKKAAAPPAEPAKKPAPAKIAPTLYDDDEDDGVTLVAVMSEEIKALRQGTYRHGAPGKAPAADGPNIVIDSEDEVDALLVEELLFDEEPGEKPPKIRAAAAAGTDVGRRRRSNEDEVLVMNEKHTYVVADGMGGHNAGEIASKLVVGAIEKAIANDRFEGEENIFWPRLGDELARAIEEANRLVFKHASSDAELQGMGTTVTAIRLSAERQRAYIAHVGDSPCMRLRGGKLEQLTTDHTFNALLGVEGPMGEHLTRAVGIEPSVEVDLQVDIPEPGDLYILCSDGLTKMVPMGDIHRILKSESTIDKQVKALIDEANGRGGRDNISVVIVAIMKP